MFNNLKFNDMGKRVFTLVILVITIIFTNNCSTTEKVNKKKELSAYNEKTKLLKSILNLTDKEITKVINNDSVSNQVLLSIKDSLSPSLIKKHLNLFIEGKYNTKETWLFLKLQTRYKNSEFDLASKKESVNYPEFKSMKELEKHLDKIDSILSKPIKMIKVETIRIDSIKTDSTKKKKH